MRTNVRTRTCTRSELNNEGGVYLAMATASGSLPSLSKEAISKLDGILNCPICLDSYTDPRALPCLHTYCKKCIDHLPAVERSRRPRVVKCPECRKVCQLGGEGASSLPKAFHVSNLQEIKESLKFSSNEPHPECSKHKNIKNLFCKRCQVLMCLKCSHESHSDHLDDIDEADTIFGKHVQQIQSSLQPLNMKVDEATRMLTQFDDTERKIEKKGEDVKKEINSTIEQHIARLQELIVTLRLSKESLLNDVDAATHQKLELHSLERAELETVLVRLKSCKEFVEKELQLRSQYQIQTAKNKLVQRIEDTHSTIKVSELRPGQNADIAYARKRFTLTPPDVGSVKSTFNYRSVNGFFSVDIPQCVLHGVTNEVSLMTSLSQSVKLVQCKMKNIAHSGEATSCAVKQVDKGHFKVLLNPDEPGPHELSVCIGGTHVTGSPFKVPVMSIAEWRGQRLKVFARGLKHPCGLAVTHDGNHVVVTEWQGHCVAVFSAATGELLHRFGQHGTGPREFVEPDEVDVFRYNHILVKDEESIRKITLNGSHEEAIPMRYNGLDLDNGSGMAVLPCGSFLTSVELPHRTGSSIIKVQPPVFVIGLQGHWVWSEIVRQFDGEPADIAVDTVGKIYVLTEEHGIHTFTPEGRYINSFGKELNNLEGFCIDSNNIVYVTDGNKVKIFNTEGRLLGSFGNHPKLRGIVVSKTTGDLYISKASGEVLVSRNT